MSMVMRKSGVCNITHMNNEPVPSLEDLQKAVDGYIEIVYLENGAQMIVNENGLVYNLPQNMAASEMANTHIAGNVVILNGTSKLS